MQAIEITKPGAVRQAKRPPPTPSPGGDLVRILTAGHCDTDLSTFRGVYPLVGHPRVLDHEIAAEVVGLGDGVSDGIVA